MVKYWCGAWIKISESRLSRRSRYCSLLRTTTTLSPTTLHTKPRVDLLIGRMAGSHMISNPPMQSTAFLGPSPATHLASIDPLRASVSHLLSRAYALPCSTAAQAFSQLVQPTSRFQLALDALLPLLSNSNEVISALQLYSQAFDSSLCNRHLI